MDEFLCKFLSVLKSLKILVVVKSIIQMVFEHLCKKKSLAALITVQLRFPSQIPAKDCD